MKFHVSRLTLAMWLAVAGALPSEAAVRFVALGDAGTGSADQHENAKAIARVCAAKGCDLALYLGDNFYNNGLTGPYDVQLVSKFEKPYAELDIPFYAILGNHDYGDPPVDAWKPYFEIAYSYRSAKWKMPSHFYRFAKENVEFFALDTQGVMLGISHKRQTEWLRDALAGSDAQWKIVLGHHPYVSNGEHGNAGNYEGCSKDCPDEVSGRQVKLLVEASVCGRADVYFSGHDHNLQWLKPRCGTEFIVSGAGSKIEPFRGRDGNPVYWASEAHVGFMWVEIDGKRLTGEYYDKAGELLFTRSFTK
jgi:tartrate-resistant acid phosphatase type 5